MTATAESWNTLHTQRRHALNYPSEPVVRFLHNFKTMGGYETALDVGCGAGRHMKLMVELGYTACGIDYSDEALSQAGQYGEVCNADMAALPYPDGMFDLALGIGTLYYGTKADMFAAAMEIRRVLKPDTGHALLTLRTWDDWRMEHGVEVEDGTIVFNLAGEPEHGMTMHFTSRRDLLELVQAFKGSDINLLEETSMSGTRKNSDWLVVVRA